ncbi:MAG: hypothetical protein Ct9H300mP27_03800 [Chloroflexota bacterium]|nr:MAG: hypothetical protein Ct9H300mP27_03800 [Chloroflexota bacterium]
MINQITGVIARSKGAPVELTTNLVPTLERRSFSQGKSLWVCHTDLHYREGSINNDFPFLLGQKLRNIESVGEDVTASNQGICYSSVASTLRFM